MPKAPVELVPYPIKLSDEFVWGLGQVWSERVVGQIRHLIDLLPTMPEIGSLDVRPALARLYGPNLRKLTVSTFVIIYRFDGTTVDVLACVYGPSVK